MRILILSDLHIDFWSGHGPHIDLAVGRPDVVILAGDIHAKALGIPWAARTFGGIPVLYVHGNHEAYGTTIEGLHDSMGSACSEHPTIHFLNCTERIIGKVRFLGATLWTDFLLYGENNRAFSMLRCESALMDYRHIRLAKQGYRKLLAADTAAFHVEQVKWLKHRLAEPFAGKTVVITHMAPTMLSLADRFRNDFVSAGFVSNLDRLVAQADVWVHGHTHDSFSYWIGKCRVVCNPRGYPNKSGGTENPAFDPNLVIDV